MPADDVDKMRQEHRLLAVEHGGWLYPEFQFRDQKPLTLLSRVLEAHKMDSPWHVLDCLISPNFAGKSLLDSMQDNDDAAVDLYLRQHQADGFIQLVTLIKP